MGNEAHASHNEANVLRTKEENMKLWNSVSDTDPKFTKQVKLGSYKFTDIDSMWNIRRATEIWGPFGSTWGLRDLHITTLFNVGDPISHITQATFFYPGGEFPIAADMPFDPRGEVLKKLQTMCIGKSLSRLGFSADVYMGQFDDSAYVAEQEKKYANRDSNVDSIVGVVDLGGPSATIEKPKSPPAQTAKKKYPEPDPVASGILGALAQKYMDLLTMPGAEGKLYDGYVVSFKKVCQSVYDAFGMYPTKLESIPKMLEAVPLDKVIDKNDFIEGVN